MVDVVLNVFPINDVENSCRVIDFFRSLILKIEIFAIGKQLQRQSIGSTSVSPLVVNR
jgi:hypothetical protein